jgi:putative peptide zinc metalloprotease protein
MSDHRDKLNPYFAQVVMDTEGELLILRSSINSVSIKISASEYDMLKDFSGDNDLEGVFLKYSALFEMDRSMLCELIARARKLRLLIRDEELASYRAAATQHLNFFSGLLNAVLLVVQRWLKSMLKLNMIIEMRGNGRFYKVFAFNLRNTMFEDICSSRLGQRIFFVAMIFLFAIFATDPLVSGKTMGDMLLSPANEGMPVFFGLVLLSVLVAFSYLIHELGHYVVYKYFGGTSSEMGFAFLYVFLPVVYTSTDTMYFWSNKWKKIAVEGAGLLTDVAMAMCLIFLAGHFPEGPLQATRSILFIFILVRIAANLNFFIPGTDGYFIVSDFFNVENLFEKCYANVKSDFREIAAGHVLVFVRSFGRQWTSHTYIYISWFFVALHWTSVFIILFLPFYLSML